VNSEMRDRVLTDRLMNSSECLANANNSLVHPLRQSFLHLPSSVSRLQRQALHARVAVGTGSPLLAELRDRESPVAYSADVWNCI